MACLAQTVEVLRPFSQAMEALEGDQYPTLSLVNLLFNGITATLMKLAPQATRPVRNLIVHLQQQLQERENISEIRDLRSMAALLDPRTKNDVEEHYWGMLPQF